VTDPVQITLVINDNCGFCDHAKQILRRLGDTVDLVRWPLEPG
jgi:hypothetical protein